MITKEEMISAMQYLQRRMELYQKLLQPAIDATSIDEFVRARAEAGETLVGIQLEMLGFSRAFAKYDMERRTSSAENN